MLNCLDHPLLVPGVGMFQVEGKYYSTKMAAASVCRGVKLYRTLVQRVRKPFVSYNVIYYYNVVVFIKTLPLKIVCDFRKDVIQSGKH